MIDKDHVFARFQENRTTPANTREQRVIARRGAGAGSRVVEVVHVRSGTATKPDKRPAVTQDARLRAATWADGFTARQVSAGPPPEPMPAPDAPAPTCHVMPRWEPTHREEAPPPAPEAPRVKSARRKAEPVSRSVADPFDAEDDRANCLRCGYTVERERDQRGMLTCARCG